MLLRNRTRGTLCYRAPFRRLTSQPAVSTPTFARQGYSMNSLRSPLTSLRRVCQKTGNRELGLWQKSRVPEMEVRIWKL